MYGGRKEKAFLVIFLPSTDFTIEEDLFRDLKLSTLILVSQFSFFFFLVILMFLESKELNLASPSTN